MKINSITDYSNKTNQYNQYNTIQIPYNNQYSRKIGNQNGKVNFEGRLFKLFGIDPIWNFHKFSVSEYNTLTKGELINLRKQYFKMYSKNPIKYERIEKLHEGVSEYMRQTMDNLYGEGNYVVITIGRSMSSIGKVLGYKIGEQNVINIPMTNAARYLDMKKVDALNNKKELREFLKYLDSLGLGKGKIKNSDKQYIITDFCCTGCSLMGAENLFKSKYVWDGPKNVSKMDFLSDWAMVNDTSVINDFMSGEYKKLAFVSRCCSLSDCANRTINPMIEPRQTKLIWFKLLDNQMQKQFSSGLNTLS